MSKLQVKILLDYAKYKRLLKMVEDSHEKRLAVSAPEPDNEAEKMDGGGISQELVKNKEAIEDEILKNEHKTGLTEPPTLEPQILNSSEQPNSTISTFNAAESEAKKEASRLNSTLSEEESSIIEKNLLEKAPKSYKSKMRKFLKKLRLHRDSISFTKSDDLIINGKLVPDAKFSDITLRLFSGRKPNKLLCGEQEYLAVLKNFGLLNNIVNKNFYKPSECLKKEKPSCPPEPWYFIGQ